MNTKEKKINTNIVHNQKLYKFDRTNVDKVGGVYLKLTAEYEDSKKPNIVVCTVTDATSGQPITLDVAKKHIANKFSGTIDTYIARDSVYIPATIIELHENKQVTILTSDISDTPLKVYDGSLRVTNAVPKLTVALDAEDLCNILLSRGNIEETHITALSILLNQGKLTEPCGSLEYVEYLSSKYTALTMEQWLFKNPSKAIEMFKLVHNREPKNLQELDEFSKKFNKKLFEHITTHSEEFGILAVSANKLVTLV